MNYSRLALILVLIGISLGVASGAMGLLGDDAYELLLIIAGIPFIIVAYCLILKRDSQIVAPEINIVHYDDDNPDEEVEGYREYQKYKRDYKALAKDVFNRSKSTGIEMLTGEPKFAIFFISAVMLIPYLASQVNLFIDTMWVSNLGPESVAAVGVIKPFMVIIVCIANGIGIGGSNRISFYLGKGDKAAAEKVITNTLMFGIVASLVLTVVLLVFMGPILDLIGAGDVKDLALDYALPLNICIVITMTASIMANIMRSEGAVGKVTLSLTLSVIINMALDPVLIFVADLGISGAAWATCISILCTIFITYYWYSNGSMYLKLRFFGKFNKQYISEINSVATPRALEESFSGAQLMIQRIVLIAAGGYVFVTLQDVGYTYMYLLQAIPSAIGAAVLTVCSVAAGQKDLQKMRTALITSFNSLLLISLLISILLFVFAEPLMSLFIHGDSVALADDIIWTARLYCIVIPIFAISRLCSSVMQVLRRSRESARMNLISVAIRIVLLFIPLMLGDSSFAAISFAIAIGYIVESVIKVSFTLYFYSHMDFEHRIAV